MMFPILWKFLTKHHLRSWGIVIYSEEEKNCKNPYVGCWGFYWQGYLWRRFSLAYWIKFCVVKTLLPKHKLYSYELQHPTFYNTFYNLYIFFSRLLNIIRLHKLPKDFVTINFLCSYEHNRHGLSQEAQEMLTTKIQLCFSRQQAIGYEAPIELNGVIWNLVNNKQAHEF